VGVPLSGGETSSAASVTRLTSNRRDGPGRFHLISHFSQASGSSPSIGTVQRDCMDKSPRYELYVSLYKMCFISQHSRVGTIKELTFL